jgi:hypothetical protein
MLNAIQPDHPHIPFYLISLKKSRARRFHATLQLELHAYAYTLIDASMDNVRISG